MKHIESLAVKYHQEKVGTLSLSADGKVCTFEYDNQWLASGFSISPLELPLKPGLFIAKAIPFNGNFGIFEDSLPDGYGRYLLHKALLKEGINDFELSALDRLSIVGNGLLSLRHLREFLVSLCDGFNVYLVNITGFLLTVSRDKRNGPML